MSTDKSKNHYVCIGCSKNYNTYKMYPYGWICLDCRKTTKLPIICSVCGKEFKITWDTYRTKDPNIPWRCRECNDKYRNEVYNNKSDEDKKIFVEKQRQRSSEYWKNLSKEDKEKDSKRRKALWDERYKTSKAVEILETMKSGRANWWNSLSEEDKKQEIGRLSNIHQNWFENATTEEIEEWKLKISANSKYNWSLLTKEERMKRMEGIHNGCINFWKNMTVKQYQDWKLKFIKGYKDYIDNVNPYGANVVPNKNENAFINEMSKNKIKCIFQYPNTKIHPDFDKIFPYNLVTKADFNSPYHMWDFLIHTTNSDVFVDVDGSMHFKDTYSRTHPYTKITYKELDYKKFLDSQRPYQTDGLPAYAVLCYDDNLTDDTPVKNIITNEIMTFKQFISILSFMDMTKDEQKEILKINNTKH